MIGKIQRLVQNYCVVDMAMRGDNMGGETHSFQDELKDPVCIAGKHCPIIFLHARNAVASTSRREKTHSVLCISSET